MLLDVECALFPYIIQTLLSKRDVMSNSISIDAPTHELQRGESMEIPIVLRLESAIKVRGIHARFSGAEETKATYTTTSTNSKGSTTTTTHTAVEYANITEQKKLLAGNERAGFFANLADAVATLFGGGRKKVMPPGDYHYLIEISMPATAPPTHVAGRSRVFYELTCLVDIPLGRDLKEVFSFHLAPLEVDRTASTVLVRYPEDEGRGFWDKLLGPDVQIGLALVEDAIYPGGSIAGIFKVTTEEPIKVRTILVRLVGHETSVAHGHSDSRRYNGKAIEIDMPGSIHGEYSKEFLITADTAEEMPVTATGKLFSIEWFVQVELDVPWAKDPKIRAPIERIGSA
jgi:hypothetical protein